MTYAGKKAEDLVYKICKNSFLSMWSYSSPLGKKNKELCDVLVVCGNHIIIFSVKDIKFKTEGEYKLNQDRWYKNAVEDSSKQIYGAERWLNNANNVIKSNRKTGIKLPGKEERIIHRVAVAFGGLKKAYIKYGDLGKGFIHVFDEISIDSLLSELDTIKDFTNYLGDKEKFLNRDISLMHQGEEDLLALYLQNNRSFPENPNLIILEEGLWNKFKELDEYKYKEKHNTNSYVWDNLIETISKDILGGSLEFEHPLNEAESAVRVMALEDRFSRRILGREFGVFMDLAAKEEVRARMLKSYSNIVYVFLAPPKSTDRKSRGRELKLRCLIARGMNQECTTVIGIATERYDGLPGFSLDLIQLYIEEWDNSLQEQMGKIQKDLGYFSSPRLSKIDEQEFA